MKLLRFLYIMVLVCLIFFGLTGIAGVITASILESKPDVIHIVLYALDALVGFSGFVVILILLIKNRHYIW